MRVSIFAVLLLSVSLPVHAQRGYPPVIEGAKEIVYKEASGTKLKLWAFYPEGAKPSKARPAIIFFFGGGWKSGSPMQFVPQSQHLAKQGMVAMVADYRVASRHQTKVKDCVADARDAIRYVRAHAKELGIDPGRVAAGGGSAGGHIAACLGTIEDDAASKPNAMALFNPACVLAPVEGIEPRGRDRSAEMKARMGVDPVELSPYHHVTSDAPPCVIFHGTADTTVPFRTAELFSNRMTEEGAKCALHGYEGEGHGFFNFGRKSKEGGEPAYEKTLEQLDQFFIGLGWLGK